ncbi:MAG TPA: VTT domain-containing protein [Anaerolineae bacterium]|nr:VTT domain-containing protein [Anaerolineae bacterium]
MSSIETFLNTYGLIAIFAVMLIKAIGVPIPIPADVIMLATSARVVEGKFILWQAFVSVLIALLIGGLIQFLIVRGPGRKFLYRFGRYLGLTATRLDAAASIVKQRNPIGLGLIILTPGVRAISVPACGIADVPIGKFTVGLLIGEGLFLSLHFFLGAIIGSLVSQFAQVIPLPILIVAISVLVLLSLGMWIIIRRRQRPALSRRQLVAESFEVWHSATCPVCLTLGAVSRVNSQV